MRMEMHLVPRSTCPAQIPSVTMLVGGLQTPQRPLGVLGMSCVTWNRGETDRSSTLWLKVQTTFSQARYSCWSKEEPIKSWNVVCNWNPWAFSFQPRNQWFLRSVWKAMKKNTFICATQPSPRVMFLKGFAPLLENAWGLANFSEQNEISTFVSVRLCCSRLGTRSALCTEACSGQLTDPYICSIVATSV